MLRPNKLHPAPYEKPPRELRGWKGNRWIPFFVAIGTVVAVVVIGKMLGLHEVWFETASGRSLLSSPNADWTRSWWSLRPVPNPTPTKSKDVP